MHLLLVAAAFAARGQTVPQIGAPIVMGNTVVTASAQGSLAPADPSLGTTSYAIGSRQIGDLPLGSDARFSQVEVRTPGVSLDSDGLVHFRNEDPYYEYSLNGVVLPPGIEGFMEDLDTGYIQSASIKIGALPANYGAGDKGAIDIVTKSGAGLEGASATFLGGSRGMAEGTLTAGGSNQGWEYLVMADQLRDDFGIENPTPAPDALHDRSRQTRFFVDLDHQLSDATRLSLIAGSSDGWYQIPDNPGQSPNLEIAGPFPKASSAALDESQVEQARFAILALTGQAGGGTFQLAEATRQSQVEFNPDRLGDLYFNGVASVIRQSILTTGIQGDMSWGVKDASRLRAGFEIDGQWARDGDGVGVFESDGVDPDTGDPIATGAPFPIIDRHQVAGFTGDAYAEEDWKLAEGLTLDLGARLDWEDAYVDEAQLGPRLALVWALAPQTSFHAGYARYFQAPPLEEVSPSNIRAFEGTTNASEVETDDPVKCERSDYFDAGVTHAFPNGVTAAFDSYFKSASQLIDDGQFGAANIFSPYNYAQAQLYGATLALDYTSGPWTLYANLSGGFTAAKGIDSSEFEFDPDELAYISSHYIPLDQTQKWTGSAGVARRWGPFGAHADLLYGSGQRNGFANQGHLASYDPVDAGIDYRVALPGAARLEVRLDVVNLFDQVSELDDGTGIGVGAPRYGARRGIFGSVSWSL